MQLLTTSTLPKSRADRFCRTRKAIFIGTDAIKFSQSVALTQANGIAQPSDRSLSRHRHHVARPRKFLAGQLFEERQPSTAVISGWFRPR